jgi:hypothetical protein
MTSAVEWRIYCNTEQANVYGILLEGQGQPTQCFNDPAHEINPESILQTDRFSKTEVVIKEEDTPTGGHFKAVSYEMICPPGKSTHDFSFPFAISALTTRFNASAPHQGDTVELSVAPDVNVGFLTQAVSSGVREFIVSSTAAAYLKLGFYMKLSDGVNTDNLGRIIHVNKNTNTIRTEFTTTHPFGVSPITFVKMTIKPIDDFKIGFPGSYVIGTGKIGGSYIPANFTIRIEYTNIHDTTINFYPMVEFLY